MIEISLLTKVFIIVWIHFIADFVLQSTKMAKNKSTSIKWLSIHVGTYTIPWFIFGWKFALITGATHWITDFLTSKMTKYLWDKKEVHWFFVVIGFDQAIHMSCFLILLKYNI